MSTNEIPSRRQPCHSPTPSFARSNQASPAATNTPTVAACTCWSSPPGNTGGWTYCYLGARKTLALGIYPSVSLVKGRKRKTKHPRNRFHFVLHFRQTKWTVRKLIRFRALTLSKRWRSCENSIYLAVCLIFRSTVWYAANSTVSAPPVCKTSARGAGRIESIRNSSRRRM